MTREQLIDTLLEWEERDRLELAGLLLETTAGPPDVLDLDDTKLLDELDRRATDGAKPIPWAQVRAELTRHDP